MKNLYNKGPFRMYEYGKIPTYLKKYGNKKWRRTEKFEIQQQLSELVKFRKKRRKKQVLIYVKITKRIFNSQHSDYKKIYVRKNHFKMPLIILM